MTKNNEKNYTVRFYDEDSKKNLYFAGFMTSGINGKKDKVLTGSSVVVKKMTKEEAEKILKRINELYGYERTTKVVKV